MSTDSEIAEVEAAQVTEVAKSSDNVVAERPDLPLPEIRVEDGKVKITADSMEQINSIFGTESDEFANALIAQCITISGMAEKYERDKMDALAMVKEIAPRDAVEAMLATQMTAVQLAMMRQSRFLASADNLAQLDAHERTFNKLARTFTAQMEALRKHRNGGQQKVTVEHVTVNDGGQAIVGAVAAGGVVEK